MAFTVRQFLGLAVLAVIASRLVVILLTPAWGESIDLAIYREIGELVANGVDPYDVRADEPLREALRQNGRGGYGFVTATRERYDYYVSSNPPASAALFGVIAWISDDRPFIWRLAFMLGDVALALAGFFFLTGAGIRLDTISQRLSFLALAVAWPSLVMWGTLVPEDKQFETALMLLAAGLMMRPPARPALKWSMAMGTALSLSIMFKAIGVFLLPVAADVLRKRPLSEALAAGAAGLAAIVAFAVYFDPAFFGLIAARTAQGAGAIHSSPWTLLTGEWTYRYARPLVCAILSLAVLAAGARRKLDPLNAIAALTVIGLCLWIATGSMDRMNIAMMFALFAFATISPERWPALVLANFALQAPVYGFLVVGLKLNWIADVDLPRWDAWVTVAFLASYFGFLFSRTRQKIGGPFLMSRGSRPDQLDESSRRGGE